MPASGPPSADARQLGRTLGYVGKGCRAFGRSAIVKPDDRGSDAIANGAIRPATLLLHGPAIVREQDLVARVLADAGVPPDPPEGWLPPWQRGRPEGRAGRR